MGGGGSVYLRPSRIWGQRLFGGGSAYSGAVLIGVGRLLRSVLIRGWCLFEGVLMRGRCLFVFFTAAGRLHITVHTYYLRNTYRLFQTER